MALGPAIAQDVELDAGAAVDTAVAPDAEPGDGPADEAVTAATVADAPPQPAPAAPAANAPAASAPAATRPAQPTSFILRDIRFANSSRLLDATEIADAVAELTGRRYARSQAGAIAAALNALYAAKGYGFSQVVLDAFDPNRGTITVRFYEPTVGKVQGGSEVMSNAYLSRRMNLPEDTPADAANISERVERIGVTDGVALTYTPIANAEGGVDILVNVPDIPRHVTTVSVDNYGSEAFGTAQLTLRHRINGLFGQSDPLDLTAILRAGMKSLSLGYSTPVSSSGARLSLDLLGSNSASLDTPSVTGRVRSATAGLRLPVIARNELQVNLSATASAFSETSALAGVPTLDQLGKELTAGASVAATGDGWSFSGGAQASVGTYDDAISATTGNTYAAVSGNASFTTLLGEALFGSISAQGQMNVSGMQPSQRTFTATAPYAVRGYPTGLMAGDSGYAVRLQVETTAEFDIGGVVAARPFAFGDIGQAFDSTATGLGLARSVGAGLSFGNASGSLAGDVFVAKPLSTAITGWTSPSTSPVLSGSISLQF